MKRALEKESVASLPTDLLEYFLFAFSSVNLASVAHFFATNSKSWLYWQQKGCSLLFSRRDDAIFRLERYIERADKAGRLSCVWKELHERLLTQQLGRDEFRCTAKYHKMAVVLHLVLEGPLLPNPPVWGITEALVPCFPLLNDAARRERLSLPNALMAFVADKDYGPDGYPAPEAWQLREAISLLALLFETNAPLFSTLHTFEDFTDSAVFHLMRYYHAVANDRRGSTLVRAVIAWNDALYHATPEVSGERDKRAHGLFVLLCDRDMASLRQLLHPENLLWNDWAYNRLLTYFDAQLSRDKEPDAYDLHKIREVINILDNIGLINLVV
jgi:hypothetical protein